MSLASNIHELLMGGGSTYSYTINNSLRLRSSASAYLSRTPASAGNQKTWTFSTWLKLGTTPSSGAIFGAGNNAGANYSTFFFGTNGVLQFNCIVSSALNIVATTAAVLRDPSAWYHIVIAVDTTQATNSNGVKIYINGVQQTLTFAYYTQNANTTYSTTVGHNIGNLYSGSSYFDGYLAEVNFIDGQALDPSYFGATNTTTGTWAPKRYSGTYGTNGFYLPFSNTSGLTSGSNTGIGKDFSGNGNYWNTNNISLTAGSTYDAMLDSPTPKSSTVGNYAVLNPLEGSGKSNGNLSLAGQASGTSTIQVSSGKWYVEYVIGSTLDAYIGVQRVNTSSVPVAYRQDGTRYTGSAWVAYGASYSAGDVISLAFDLDAGTAQFFKNNTSQGVISGVSYSTICGVTVYVTTSNSCVVNFGQRPFTYTPPTGFKALQTYNLPTPAIKKGNQHFDATLYTGNGSTQSITNSGFQPDLVWTKTRSTVQNHAVYDVVRGTQQRLLPNLTNAEDTVPGVTSFNSSGFSVGANIASNESGSSFVAWQWKAGGTAVTNTAGSITSQVSANPTAGFSVVTFTSPASGSASVGHGLGVTPAMFVIKSRSPSASAWALWHTSLASTTDSYLNLNNTNAVATYAGIWGSGPNSSVFGIGAGAYVASNTYVAYCFAAIPGYSAFGSYTGNGSADGPFVFTGFLPKFVMIKIASGGTANWLVQDSARDAYNPEVYLLNPNLADAEATSSGYAVDFVANGFKLRNATTAWNYSGATFIYAAFASNPFQYSLAR